MLGDNLGWLEEAASYSTQLQFYLECTSLKLVCFSPLDSFPKSGTFKFFSCVVEIDKPPLQSLCPRKHVGLKLKTCQQENQFPC